MGSSSSVRAFGAILHKLSNGFSSKCPNFFAFQSNFFFLLDFQVHSMFIFLRGQIWVIELTLELTWDSENGFLARNLSSSSAMSSLPSWDWIYGIRHNNHRLRTIWTFSPLAMGRRSCKIAGRKVLSPRCFISPFIRVVRSGFIDFEFNRSCSLIVLSWIIV